MLIWRAVRSLHTHRDWEDWRVPLGARGRGQCRIQSKRNTPILVYPKRRGMGGPKEWLTSPMPIWMNGVSSHAPRGLLLRHARYPFRN